MRSYLKSNSQTREILKLLRKAFPDNKLNTIVDYVDLFLRIRGVKYRKYFVEFGMLLEERGFSYSSCQIEELIVDRLLSGDYEKFKLKSKHAIDKMTGVEFEIFLGRFFRRCGYFVERTPGSYDIGADLIIQLYDKKTVVQAKRRKKNIGLTAVQEVFTAKGYYRANEAMVIISSKFTASAKELAETLDVELWDRKRLMQKLKDHGFQV
jgi:restriction endonuclease Mrr